MKIQTVKRLFLPLWFTLPSIAGAQENAPQTPSSYLSNPLFISLLVLIAVLLIVIAALGKVLRNLAESGVLERKKESTDKEKENPDNSSRGNSCSLKSLMLSLLLLPASSVNAQALAQDTQKWQIGGIDQATFFLLLFVILIESIIILMLYRIIIDNTRSNAPAKITTKVRQRTVLEKINASVAIEKEKDIMLGHEYDGIKELDNDLPPWWKYGFYVTIAFAGVYLINYHVSGTGDLQSAEYEKSVTRAKAELEEYMKTAANNVDETNVKMLGEADIATGKALYTGNCIACHGKEGQGGVGPNLTDAYWLHSGGIADVFKSIKYGWVDKGMKSWKEDLSPVQIAQITSFIKSINGTNPAGAKAPQGDLYKQEELPVDSLKPSADSLTASKDSLK